MFILVFHRFSIAQYIDIYNAHIYIQLKYLRTVIHMVENVGFLVRIIYKIGGFCFYSRLVVVN